MPPCTGASARGCGRSPSMPTSCRSSRNPETFCSARGVLIHDGLRGETPMHGAAVHHPHGSAGAQPPPEARDQRVHTDRRRLEPRVRALAHESLAASAPASLRLRRARRRPAADVRHRRDARRAELPAPLPALVRRDDRAGTSAAAETLGTTSSCSPTWAPRRPSAGARARGHAHGARAGRGRRRAAHGRRASSASRCSWPATRRRAT